MRKSFYPACILALALSVGKAHAQTGIAINDNNATADPSAMLDVSVSATAKKGFLLPRMTTTQRDVIASPAKGLLIYVTNVDSLEINIGTPASPKWFAFGNGSSAVSGWQLKGNTGTNISTDFVGTADNVDLAFRTNNFERLRISNAGNVGIGNTAPTQKLDVTGAVKFSGALMPNNDPGTAGYFLVSAGAGLPPVWFNAGGYAWLIDGNTVATDKKFGTISNNNLPFITNNIERMRITNAGFVGIGTTTPTNTLHVSAASNPLALTGVQNGVITDSLLSIDPTTGVVRRLSVSRFTGWSYNGDAVAATTTLGTTSNFDLPFITNNTERMRIANSGRITMGTTSIANTLSISSSSNPLTLTGVQNGVITDSVLSIDPTTGVVRRLSVARFQGWSYGGDAVAANTNLGTTTNFDLPFITNNTESMRLTKAGNLGIGTTTPAYKLQVTAASNPLALSGVQSALLTDSILTIDPTTGVVKRMAMSRLQDWSYGGDAVTANTNFGTTSNFDLPFIANNAEWMRLTKTGNFGIGTTTPGYKLQVSAASNPLALTGVQSGTMTDSLLSIDPTTGVVRRLSINRLSGWSYNGDAVTATTNLGTTSNFDLPFIANNSEWMRLTKTGNFGIGTTAAGNKLTVVATNPLALYGVQVGTTTTSDSVLTITNGIVKKVAMSNFSTGTSTDWKLTGNSGTSAGTNFVGTTDDVPLMFKMNNTEAGYIGNSANGYAVEFGNNAVAAKWSNTYSVAIGASSIAWNPGATSVGGKAATSGNATAVGYNANAAQEAIAIGSNATASGNEGVSIGTGSTTNFQSVSVGRSAVSAQSGVAVGYSASTTAQNTAAIGSNSVAGGQNGSAVGSSAKANGFNSNAFGFNSNASAQSASTFGSQSAATGYLSTSIGYGSSASNANSTAIGANASVSNDNTVVIGSGTTAVLMNSGAYNANRALVVGTGGGNGNGAYLTTGGVWTNASDKNLKESFSKVSGADVLAKIMALDVTKWKYKGTNEYHIGPMAQDFFAAFSLGTDDKHISSLDPSGVALVAIQELKKENEELTKRVDDQQKLLEQLLKEVNELKAKVK
ncbi:tail fiber domain-containing protein [Pinibacter aurantiacus]|uniref:Tail fiber domain-containing protein n=1 Tax=Pinibacter aurantiacus TaxID=2851599 RepID=A0A9E2SFN9_9BACT|nr:tail fiber domain-containing protein [Pinibacter aurantiacus]MBV4359440.1 tail fiber domain-containing protein [Pinibacter aurantiacus]